MLVESHFLLRYLLYTSAGCGLDAFVHLGAGLIYLNTSLRPEIVELAKVIQDTDN